MKKRWMEVISRPILGAELAKLEKGRDEYLKSEPRRIRG